MSGLRRYDEYVDRTTQTFNELPASWDSIRARHVVRIRTGSGDTVDAEPEGAYPFYVRSDQPLRSSRWEFDTTAVLTAGDGAGVAKVFHLVDGKFMAHQRVYVLNGFKRMTPQFFYYAFSSMFFLMALDGSAKSTVDSVRRHMIADMPLPLPSLEEQRAIVNFLDDETAQIDLLVAEQERLIALLSERRAAVVDRVVWEGTDESALASPTGIDPVPVAPVHWRRLRNKNLLFESPDLSQGGEDLLSVSHLTGVTPRAERSVTMAESEDLSGYRRVRAGELVINTMWAWMGALGVSRVDGIVSPAYGVYQPRLGAEFDPRYFDYLYRSRPYVTEMTRHSRGIWSSRLRIYPEVFLSLHVVVPPLDEQAQIATLLDQQTSKLDLLVAEANRFIELARERRSALITAAVTGQIDCRVSPTTTEELSRHGRLGIDG